MVIFGKKLVERRVILSADDLPRLDRDQEAEIITVLSNGDIFTSKYTPNKDSRRIKLNEIVNNHLRIDQAMCPNPLLRPLSLSPPPRRWPGNQYVKIEAPSHDQLLVAANIFNDRAIALGISYVIVGGFAAQLYGGVRPTKSLDILLKPPYVMGQRSHIQPAIQDLFNRNPGVLETTFPDQFGQQDRIVIIGGNVGITIKFFDSVNNNIGFKPIIPTSSVETHLERTWQFVVTQNNLSIRLPVLLPRHLLYQRILNFGTHLGEETQIKDIADIHVFLSEMRRYHQVFPQNEAWELRRGVINILYFSQQRNIVKMLDRNMWREVNIHLQ